MNKLPEQYQAINPQLALTDPENLRRLHWACRRGMWELDILLQSFLEQRFCTLDIEQQQCFVDLLYEADQDLFQYLLQAVTPNEPRFVAMIELIRQHGKPR